MHANSHYQYQIKPRKNKIEGEKKKEDYSTKSSKQFEYRNWGWGSVGGQWQK